MINPLLERWKNNETLTNAWVTIPSSWSAEIIAHAGFDIMTIDAQHGLALNSSEILPMLQAIKGTDTIPFVRLPENNSETIMQMLDVGVLGLICPMINSASETDAFVKAAHYYPKGIRSYGPLRASTIYGDEYFEKANDNIITMAMIETPAALKNIREIAKTPNLSGFYVGPWDLSLSLGFKKMADFESPQLLDILAEILEIAKQNNLKVGIHSGSPENSRKMSEMGFRLVTTFNDSTALKNAAKESLIKYGNKEKKRDGY